MELDILEDKHRAATEIRNIVHALSHALPVCFNRLKLCKFSAVLMISSSPHHSTLKRVSLDSQTLPGLAMSSPTGVHIIWPLTWCSDHSR